MSKLSPLNWQLQRGSLISLYLGWFIEVHNWIFQVLFMLNLRYIHRLSKENYLKKWLWCCFYSDWFRNCNCNEKRGEVTIQTKCDICFSRYNKWNMDVDKYMKWKMDSSKIFFLKKSGVTYLCNHFTETILIFFKTKLYLWMVLLINLFNLM